MESISVQIWTFTANKIATSLILSSGRQQLEIKGLMMSKINLY